MLTGGKRRFPLIILFLLLSPLLLFQTGCSKKEKEAPKAVKKVWMERWVERRPMQQKRAGLAVVAVGRRIYAIGGGEYSRKGLLIFKSVEYTDVAEDGSLGPWKYAPSLTMPRIYPAAVVYNGYIYVMGGESLDRLFTGKENERAPELQNTIERARINPDGTIGQWVLEKEKMHFPRRGGELFASGGWLYAGGGFGGDFLNDFERAKINPDGSIGKWQEAAYTARDRYISGYAQKDGRFYVIGGHMNGPERAMESVETTEAKPDGTLGEWTETSPLYTRRFLNTALVKDDVIYTFAGHNTINLSSSEHAPVKPDGSLGKWEPDTPLNIARRAAASVAVGDNIYVLGGMVKPLGMSDSVNIVESARVSPGKRLGNFVEEGSKEYEDYLKWKEAVPLDAMNHLRRGRAYLKSREYDTVLFDVKEALKMKPDLAAAYDLEADVYFDMGKLDLAEESLKKALNVEDLNFYALVGLGYLSFQKGEYKSAVKYYERAVKVEPDSEIAHFNLGNAYLNAGDKGAAAREFRWVLKKNPASTEAKHLLKLSEEGTEGVLTEKMEKKEKTEGPEGAGEKKK